MSERPDNVDRRRVRIGLAIVCVVFVVAFGLGIVIDDPLGRTLMFAVLVVSAIRAALLIRSIRRRGAE